MWTNNIRTQTFINAAAAADNDDDSSSDIEEEEKKEEEEEATEEERRKTRARRWQVLAEMLINKNPESRYCRCRCCCW